LNLVLGLKAELLPALACIAGNDYLDDKFLKPLHTKIGVLPRHGREERVLRVINYLATSFKINRILGFLTENCNETRKEKISKRFELCLGRYKLLTTLEIEQTLAPPLEEMTKEVQKSHSDGCLPSVILGVLLDRTHWMPLVSLTKEWRKKSEPHLRFLWQITFAIVLKVPFRFPEIRE
jgi:hypothetical protein